MLRKLAKDSRLLLWLICKEELLHKQRLKPVLKTLLQNIKIKAFISISMKKKFLFLMLNLANNAHSVIKKLHHQDNTKQRKMTKHHHRLTVKNVLIVLKKNLYYL